MLRHTLFALMGLALVLGTGFVTVFSEGKDAPKDLDFKKVQEEFAKLHAPGEEHKMVQSCAGEWIVEGKMYMEPGKDGAPVKGWSVHKKLGDTFTQENLTLVMDGHKMWGTGIFGFDNESKQFQCTFIGGWSTTQRVMNGMMDAKNKSVEFKCDYTCPITHKKITERVVNKMESDTKMSVTIYMKMEGMDEMKHMELNYTKLQ